MITKLKEMASGLVRCMYCEDSMGTDIDHFRPKSNYPGYVFQWSNYFLACSHCNSNQKRSQFPILLDGSLGLIDPAIDDPLDHLLLTPSSGFYAPLTTRGEETIRVFGLNRQVCAAGRAQLLVTIGLAFSAYVADPGRRAELLKYVQRTQFRAVFSHVGRAARSPGATAVLDPIIVEAVLVHPELVDWASA